MGIYKKRSQTETISFRGNKKVWREFVFVLRNRGEKSVWSVLKKMIENYINEDK